MTGYENVCAQAERLEVARARLQAALDDLSRAAKRESRKALPEVDPVLGLVGEVKRAEEAYDLAHLDLETARGEDA